MDNKNKRYTLDENSHPHLRIDPQVLDAISVDDTFGDQWNNASNDDERKHILGNYIYAQHKDAIINFFNGVETADGVISRADILIPFATSGGLDKDLSLVTPEPEPIAPEPEPEAPEPEPEPEAPEPEPAAPEPEDEPVEPEEEPEDEPEPKEGMNFDIKNNSLIYVSANSAGKTIKQIVMNWSNKDVLDSIFGGSGIKSITSGKDSRGKKYVSESMSVNIVEGFGTPQYNITLNPAAPSISESGTLTGNDILITSFSTSIATLTTDMLPDSISVTFRDTPPTSDSPPSSIEGSSSLKYSKRVSHVGFR